jgi:metallo-beta-lactamase class B
MSLFDLKKKKNKTRNSVSPLRNPLTLFVLLISLTISLVSPAQSNPEWSKDYPPFRMAGNLYFVGTYDLGCFLITTPQGHILINTGLATSTPMIKKHIEALGFKFKDIRTLLTMQAHFDHAGAMAEIKKLTGATLMVNAADASVMADGGASDYAFGGKGSLFTPVKADRLLHDGDTISLGGTTIKLLHHPGHTKGSCSYLLNVKDDKRTYRVLLANMPSVVTDIKKAKASTYPEIEKDYNYTFGAMKKIQFDLWMPAHVSQFDFHKKRKPGDPYDPELFADKQAYQSLLSELEDAYHKKANQ